MRREYSLKRLLCAILTLSLSVISAGCSKKQVSFTLGEWIELLCEKAGIQDYVQEYPYFLNIGRDQTSYEAVQAAVEWEVLDPVYAFDPDEELTNEWTAYTLMNLSGMDTDHSDETIHDISNSKFQKQIKAAVSSGLMKTDSRNCFHPEQKISKEDALKMLDQIIAYINDRTFEPSSEIQWKEENIIEEEPAEFDETEGTALFSENSTLKEGNIVCWNNEDGKKEIYQIEKAEITEEGLKVSLKEPELENAVDSMDASDSFSIDFSQAEIIDELNEESLNHKTSSHTDDYARTMSLHPYEKSHTFNGYKVSFRTTSAGFRADVSRESAHGSKLYAALSLNNVRPSFRWKMSNGNIEDAYFKVAFKTSESLGLRNGSYQSLYGDFSRINPSDFIGSIQHLLQKKQDIADITIPLCTIRVPIPNAPLFKITMQLQVKIYASGKAELSLTQNHVLGMEIRNGSMRTINENDHSAQNVIRTDTSLSSGICFGLNLEKLALADIAVQGGAKANIAATVHLIDQKGQMQSVSTDIPADVADELSSGNPNILVCADIKAYWLLDVIMNSSKTIAGKCSFSRTIHILNESNASLIPGTKRHIENGLFVDHCTRTGRVYSTYVPVPSSDQIQIKDYSLIASVGEQKEIQIVSLPKGYTVTDLTYQSEKPEIASIDSSGRITALKEGSTMITIQTKDGKYRIRCSMLVRHQAVS